MTWLGLSRDVCVGAGWANGQRTRETLKPLCTTIFPALLAGLAVQVYWCAWQSKSSKGPCLCSPLCVCHAAEINAGGAIVPVCCGENRRRNAADRIVLPVSTFATSDRPRPRLCKISVLPPLGLEGALVPAPSATNKVALHVGSVSGLVGGTGRSSKPLVRTPPTEPVSMA